MAGERDKVSNVVKLGPLPQRAAPIRVLQKMLLVNIVNMKENKR